MFKSKGKVANILSKAHKATAKAESKVVTKQVAKTSPESKYVVLGESESWRISLNNESGNILLVRWNQKAGKAQSGAISCGSQEGAGELLAELQELIQSLE